MTTPDQAALLAKHRREQCGNSMCIREHKYCTFCQVEAPCDVHCMAELKDAEIAELRSEIGRLRERIAMDDFAENTTPDGTWIERGEDA